MGQRKQINRRKYAWVDITVRLSRGEVTEIKEISYDHGRDKEAIYGKGGKPVGYGLKNSESTGKMTLSKEELTRWEKEEGKVVTDMDPFLIVVSYGTEGQDTVTDELRECTITKRGGDGAAQGDASVDIDLEFIILGGMRLNGIETQ